ncbi:hypothetical protein C8N41_102209 [Winogradskyella sediminis]|nr:hypothetical protein C8N41_102209 [Winogradskyella sediminis]
MRQTFHLLVVITQSLILTSCVDETKKDNSALDQSISKIEVMDFHSTHRCMTCKAIEATRNSH